MKMTGRTIFSGCVQGTAIVSSKNISFFGGVDPETGVVLEKGHDLEGQSISGRILVFPTGKGSTVGSYTLYRLKANDMAPLAIVNAVCEPITAVGCIISEIPCMDKVDISEIKTGDTVAVNTGHGFLEVLEKD